MCRLLSGIITRERVYIAEAPDNSHENLISRLGITPEQDDGGLFVRWELVPSTYWWVNPEQDTGSWEFTVDQMEVPEWFDAAIAESKVRNACIAWWKKYVRVNDKIYEIAGGIHYLRNCKVDYIRGNSVVILDNCDVRLISDNTVVHEAVGCTIKLLNNNASIIRARHTTIETMRVNSKIMYAVMSNIVRMTGYSCISTADVGTQISKMQCNSHINECDCEVEDMEDYSIIDNLNNRGVIRNMRGGSLVYYQATKSSIRVMEDFSTVIVSKGSITKMCGRSLITDIIDTKNVQIITEEAVILAHRRNTNDNIDIIKIKKEVTPLSKS